MFRRILALSALALLALAAPASAIEPDGSLIRTPDGAIYRVVGGAAIHLVSCAAFNGCPAKDRVEVPSLAGYGTVPKDGSFISVADGAHKGWVGRIVGGYVMHLSTCAPFGDCQPRPAVDDGGFTTYINAHPAINEGSIVRIAYGNPINTTSVVVGHHLVHLHTCAPFGGCKGLVDVDSVAYTEYLQRYPTIADGTFVRIADGARAGESYRAAGTTLLHVTDCAALGGCQNAIAIDDGALDEEVSGHPTMADGTILHGLPSGQLWKIQGGKRFATSTAGGAVDINDATIANLPDGDAAPVGSTDPAPVFTPTENPTPITPGTPTAAKATIVQVLQSTRQRRRGRKLTVFTRFRLYAEQGAKLEVRCLKKRCPTQVKKGLGLSRPVSFPKMIGRVLPYKTQFVITATLRGRIGLRGRYTARSGLVSATRQCLKPGGIKTQKCPD